MATSKPTVELPKGKGTQNTEPPPSNPPPLKRGTGAGRRERAAEDTVRRQADKARWPGYGQDESSTADLLNEQRHIEGKAPLNTGAQDDSQIDPGADGDETQTKDAQDMTVAELKQALTDAGLQVPSDAKKADLVKMYEEYQVGDE